MNSSDRLGRLDAAALALVLVPWCWLTSRYWFVCDDAYITFRYSRNLAQGFGPRYNIAKETPVEGYSDFLWMVIAALFEKASLPPYVYMPMISAVMAGGLLVWLYVFLRRHAGASVLAATSAALFVSTMPPFGVWSTSGLETMAEVLFLFGTFALLATRDDADGMVLAGLCALGLALVRTEGIAWVAVVTGVTSALRWRQGRPLLGPLVLFAGLVLAPFGVYYAWKVWYYHSWVANTALAKVHLQPITLVRGAMYVALFALTVVSPLIVLWSVPSSLRSDRKDLAAAAGVMTLAIPAYAVTVSGDYMAWFRILVPGLPFAAIGLALAYERMVRAGQRKQVLAVAAVVSTLSMLPSFDLYLVPEPARDAVAVREKLGFFRTENQQWDAMNEHVVTWTEKGRALAQYARPGERYVAAAIGAVGYFSNVYIYDRNGLVNREVAMQPWSGELRSPGHDKVVDRSFFYPNKPELLDSKVIGGGKLKPQIKAALREMEADEARATYYPELVPVDPQRSGGARQRFLLVLRRGNTPEECEARWRSFYEQNEIKSDADEAEEEPLPPEAPAEEVP